MRRAIRGAALGLVLAMLGIVLTGLPAAAQEPPRTFEVSASLRPRAATLGEQVSLVVTVRHSQDLLVSSSEPARASNIELIASGEEELVFDDPDEGVAGMATTTFEYTIAAFMLGDLHPGDVEVSWLASDGRTGSTMVRPPILRILPVRVEGDEELRPLKPQATAGASPAWWERAELPVAVGILGLAIVGALAWRRRRPRSEAVVVVEDERSPEDRARERLDALQGRALADREAYVHFYGELSIAVRAYLEDRFGFTATALTTTELSDRFEDAGVGRWQARLASGLLERCDAAVYARARPDPASADHDLTVAYEIVELSRPRRSDVPEAVSA